MRTSAVILAVCVLFFALVGQAAASPHAVGTGGARPVDFASHAAVAPRVTLADSGLPFGADIPGNDWTPYLGQTIGDSMQFEGQTKVYCAYMNAGDKLVVTMQDISLGIDVDLYLYGPNATSVFVDDPIAGSERPDTGSEEIDYMVPVSGYYYMCAYDNAGEGHYTMTVSRAAGQMDDTLPGVQSPGSPITGTVNAATDEDDVYSVYLKAGDTLSAHLNADPGNTFDIWLYDSRSLSFADAIASTSGGTYPKDLTFVAPESGCYSVDIFADSGSGSYTLTYNPVFTPVYRFYNNANGSHFYTASLAEKTNVLFSMSAAYSLDGVAYAVNNGNVANSSPLYRFYNKKNGSHFYTASPAEKTDVQSNLSAIYAYDGPAYNVCTSPPPGSGTVWRFYNKKNGSHFYTADPSERDRVANTLASIYAFDGPSFYVAP